ncbi:hypothetical protein B0181_02635 [Moraxella caviae]|uniref:Lipoprotein n=1 Tax=Moraxella caviae TaxID=34060 RepID=A0A1T0A7P1_9GAMM|nr:hypothetical protein [Moraxella caviae]OOR91766.1 hypothetical protein B0181_02635 [Moraxella caviae]STZ14190.1 Uncharacterised protein [Moraxella caviae]VEW12636.1 Uncharacterised protein [Moraxella caviae]VEW13579.1 Uncharacterised protein [Moraxella caviae]
MKKHIVLWLAVGALSACQPLPKHKTQTLNASNQEMHNQNTEQNAAQDTEQNAAQDTTSAAVVDDVDRYMQVQDSAILVSQKLNALNDPHYGDMYIQHKPDYKIVILFSDDKNRDELVRSFDKSIQPYIVIKHHQKSLIDQNTQSDEISRKIKQLNIKYSMGFDLETQTFNISVGSQQDADKVQAIVNQLGRQHETVINVGGLPVPEPALVD